MDRGAVLAGLQDGLREAERSRGALRVLAGGPGSGKTYLAQRFLTHLPADIPSLSGEAYAAGSPPLLPICKALGGATSIQGGYQLRAIVEQYADAVPVVKEVLGPLVKARAATRHGAAVASGVAPTEVFTFFALTDVLRKVTQGRAAVLFLDDAQWLDASSVSFVDHLLHEFGALPLLVLLSVRTNGADPPSVRALRESWSRLPPSRCLQLHVPPIGGRETLDVSAKLLEGPVNFSLEEASWLCETSKGNPRYLREVLELLKVRGDIQRQAGCWTFSKRPETLLVPPSLATVTLRRLEQVLDEIADAEILIQHAAVLGREFDARVLAAALEEPLPRVVASLQRIGSLSGYVSRSGTPHTFRFDHDLTRDAILQAQCDALPEIHSRLAATLEASGADSAQVARHYRAAGDLRGAASFLDRAARAAFVRGAYTSGAALAREADEALGALGVGAGEEPRWRALATRADSLIRAERFDEAERELRGRLALDGGSWNLGPPRLLALWGRALLRLPGRADHQMAVDILRTAAERSEERSADRVDALMELVVGLDAVGEYELSAAAFRRATADAQRAQIVPALVRLRRMTCIFFQPDKVAEVLRRLVGITRKHGLALERALCLNNLGAALLALQRFREAESAFAESRRELQRHGGWRQDVPLNNLGILAASEGSLSSAEEKLASALATCRDFHNTIFIRSNRAVVQALTGDVSGAIRALTPLTAEADATGDLFYRDCVRQNLAEALLVVGRPRDAIAIATECPPHRYGPDVGLIEAKRADLVARAHTARGEAPPAEVLAARVLLDQTTKPQAWRYRSPWYLIDIQFWED